MVEERSVLMTSADEILNEAFSGPSGRLCCQTDVDVRAPPPSSSIAIDSFPLLFLSYWPESIVMAFPLSAVLSSCPGFCFFFFPPEIVLPYEMQPNLVALP